MSIQLTPNDSDPDAESDDSRGHPNQGHGPDPRRRFCQYVRDSYKGPCKDAAIPGTDYCTEHLGPALDESEESEDAEAECPETEANSDVPVWKRQRREFIDN